MIGDFWRIHQIRRLARSYDVGAIPAYLESKSKLSDRVLTEGILVLKNNGRIIPIAEILGRRGLTAPVKKQANDSLQKLIRLERERGRRDAITALAQGVSVQDGERGVVVDKHLVATYEKRKHMAAAAGSTEPVDDGMRSVPKLKFVIYSCENWGRAVIEEIDAMIPIKEWHKDQLGMLLKHTDLGQRLRTAVEEALCQAPKGTP